MRDRDGGKVYLWLCCEGWVRFGPFAWLRFDDERGAILDDLGEVVAVRKGDGWHTPGSHQGYHWRDPMVTASRRHPDQGSGSPRLGRSFRERAGGLFEADTLARYFGGLFSERLAALRTQTPNEIVRQKIMQDPEAAFFGGRDWERCREDLAAVPDEERPRFILCLFVLVLLDQHVYTNFRPLHSTFQARHRVPKFGWAGFGPHNENPFKLLAVPVRDGLVGLDDLAGSAPAAMGLLAGEAAALIAGTEVSPQEFYRRMYADPAFGELATDPAAGAVVRALDAVLAAKGIPPRDFHGREEEG